MKRLTRLDAINNGHAAQERLLALGDLLSSIDEQVQESTIRTVGIMLMDEAANLKTCLDILWDGGAK